MHERVREQVLEQLGEVDAQSVHAGSWVLMYVWRAADIAAPE
jgi:hypothetical protein